MNTNPLALLVLPLLVVDVLSPQWQKQVRNRIVEVTAYKYCFLVLTSQTTLAKAAESAYEEVKADYPNLVRRSGDITAGEVEAKAQNLCPIVFGKLSKAASQQLQRQAKTADSKLGKYTNNFNPSKSSPDCSINPVQMSRLQQTGKLSLVGNSCKVDIKFGK